MESNRDDGQVLRTDAVSLQSSLQAFYPNTPGARHVGTGRVARMTIAFESLRFDPLPDAHLSWIRSAFAFLTDAAPTPARRMRHIPLTRTIRFGLAEVTRLHKWEPAFSMTPLFQIGNDGWYFQLLVGEAPWDRPAPKDAMRDHFEALEAAWNAARHRDRHSAP